MNSRQRRKIEAQQHNDAINYEKWLFEKTKGQQRLGQSRSDRVSSMAAMLISALAVSGTMVLGDD